MSEIQAWIGTRRPQPPMELGPWLDGVTTEAPSARAMTRIGVAALGRARARPGRIRDSAFRLLAADAMITYACEAALEEDDQDAVLRMILRQAAGRP